MTPKQSLKIQELYTRYEYLASVYANKVFNYHLIGMEKDDVVQEFKAKVWTSTIAFIKKWKIYRDTGNYKPTPLMFYIKANLNNLKIDLIKKINCYGHDESGEYNSGLKGFVHIDHINFDIGTAISLDTHIDFENKIVNLRGVNVLEGLNIVESKIFCLYLKGHTKKNLKKIFNLNAAQIINDQLEKLKAHENELLASQPVFTVYQMNDD